MPKASSDSRPCRPRSTRSVTGCLTCRRRKVKCAFRSTPCSQCQRLGLQCESSLEQNFKSWTVDAVATSKNGKAPLLSTGGFQQGPVVEPSGELAAAADVVDDSSLDVPDVDLSFNLIDFIFSDLATEITPDDGNSFSFDWAVQRTDETSAADPSRTVIPSNRGIQDTQVDGTVDQAISKVPGWLSTKQSIWTCYHYLINSAQAMPDSPLCQAILGWSYTYLSLLGTANTDARRETHYAAASRALPPLFNELSRSPAINGSPSCSGQHATDQLSLYMSCIFFLCQQDLMTGNSTSFLARIADVKVTFQKCWSRSITPGPVESRIVIWLAFLEQRFLYLSGERLSAREEKDLITILWDSKAFRVLRPLRTRVSALGDLFGNELPPEENEEDLKRERCRVKYDDLMMYLAKVRQFEEWDCKLRDKIAGGDEMAVELRGAKVEALHSDMLRLQAECELAFPSESSQSNSVDIGSFHKLTVDALRSSIVIVFSRATQRGIRTDHACQAAAANIVRITRMLQKKRYLRSPRSTIWPLPLFLAGIETTDGVYQDWVIDRMKQLATWGSHIVKCTELLEQIISQQEKSGSRVSIYNV